MATLSSLLSIGYFPRELPPPFETKSFAKHAKKAGAAWNTKTWTKCASHNLARPGGLRRPVRIPNPLSFFALAKLISENWDVLKAHTAQYRLSSSRPHVMKKSDRAIVARYQMGQLTRLRALRRRASRYVLHTDIDQFYASIYTHAVPWALHTKATAKAAMRAKKKLLGDLLDQALRNMNDGQTKGIPIGPDTSLVIAEVILAAADGELLQAAGGVLRGFRYVDDYELSFATLNDAEKILAELQGILAHYELGLNPRKTRIEELPQALEDAWAIELRVLP